MNQCEEKPDTETEEACRDKPLQTGNCSCRLVLNRVTTLALSYSQTYKTCRDMPSLRGMRCHWLAACTLEQQVAKLCRQLDRGMATTDVPSSAGNCCCSLVVRLICLPGRGRRRPMVRLNRLESPARGPFLFGAVWGASKDMAWGVSDAMSWSVDLTESALSLSPWK